MPVPQLRLWALVEVLPDRHDMIAVPPLTPVYPPELYTSRVRYDLSFQEEKRAVFCPWPGALADALPVLAARLFLSLSHNWKRHMPPSVTHRARFNMPPSVPHQLPQPPKNTGNPTRLGNGNRPDCGHSIFVSHAG
jgi:hypothetical protein